MPTVLGTMQVVHGEDPPGVCIHHMVVALHLLRPIVTSCCVQS